MISTRLSTLSSSEEIFDNELPIYSDALRHSGYNQQLLYKAESSNPSVPRRRRKIIWFNAPYNAKVATNVAYKFLLLSDKHFPAGSPLNKYFNRNTIKVSYSCMPNMAKIISEHNKKVLNKHNTVKEKACNCRGGEAVCPLNGKCLTDSLVYKATAKTTGNEEKLYLGLASTTFKSRFTNHKSSFNHKEQAHSTSLSTYIWKLKEQNKPFTITWSIRALAPTYKKETRSCQLCMMEKTLIIIENKENFLNKRTVKFSTNADTELRMNW